MITSNSWATELLELIAAQAQDGETPPETVRRVTEERDAFTAALAVVTEERSVLADYRHALSDERTAKAREEAAQDRCTLASRAFQPQEPHPTRYLPVFASSELPPAITLFPRA